MDILTELEGQVMQLPEDQRAFLAAQLLESLPAILHDDDAGTAEAMRRDAELDRDPSAEMSLEEFRTSFGR
jgi:Putative addiction module component